MLGVLVPNRVAPLPVDYQTVGNRQEEAARAPPTRRQLRGQGVHAKQPVVHLLHHVLHVHVSYHAGSDKASQRWRVFPEQATERLFTRLGLDRRQCFGLSP